jgi:hypothetical protein
LRQGQSQLDLAAYMPQTPNMPPAPAIQAPAYGARDLPPAPTSADLAAMLQTLFGGGSGGGFPNRIL